MGAAWVVRCPTAEDLRLGCALCPSSVHARTRCPAPPSPATLAQRGDTGAALPLYERALAIWEAACGPDSPDVAHTLTDIAVIHLEQVGRLLGWAGMGLLWAEPAAIERGGGAAWCAEDAG